MFEEYKQIELLCMFAGILENVKIRMGSRKSKFLNVLVMAPAKL